MKFRDPKFFNPHLSLFSIVKQHRVIIEDLLSIKKGQYVTENGYLKILDINEISIKIGSKIEKIKI